MTEQLTGNGIYYEEVCSIGEMGQAEAQRAGLFDCADAGMWLRQLPDGALLIEDGIEAAAERAAHVIPLPVTANMSNLGAAARLSFQRELAEAVLRAAVGEGDR